MTKQSLGQNFLMHPATGERIVQAAELSKKEHVLEIGPGTGMLTRALLKEGHSVTAVEADGELVENLVETFAEEIKSKRLKLVHEDIRTFNLSSLPKKYSLVANIPYYITGEIIRTFLTAKWKPRSMTLLVQKEAAVRITGRGERNHKESLLSISVKAYGDPKYCFTVPKGAFRPVPKVLSGNLADKYGQKKVGEAFVAASIPHKARSEDLSLADWKRLFVNLS